jgi:DNA polymerase-4
LPYGRDARVPLRGGFGGGALPLGDPDLENADAVQLRLPLESHGSSLDAALDAVRERFGTKAITRGVLLGRDEGWSPPLLPD